MMLAPELVEALQSVRERLGQSLKPMVAYQSPAARAEACAQASAPSCDPPYELSFGTAALVESAAGASAVIDAASAVGVPSCWIENDKVYIGVGPDAAGCPR